MKIKEKLTNLNDVENYIRKNLSDWGIRRGHKTDMYNPDHADEYEVLQLYRPKEFGCAYAEFWRGFYKFSPEGFTAFCGANGSGHFSCTGDFEYIMKNVMHEERRLKAAPAVLDAVMKTIEQDKLLSEISSEIGADDLDSITYDYKHWSIDCDRFKLNAITRCVMQADIDEEGTIVVKYWIQKKKLNDNYIDIKSERYVFPAKEVS